MTITNGDRLGLTRWSAGTDIYTRAQRDADNALLEDLVAIDLTGLDASRPAAGTRGTYYAAGDTGRLYRDNGTDWTELPVLYGTGGRMVLGDDARDVHALDPTARLAVSTDADGVTGVEVRGAVAQTSPLYAAIASTGATVAQVDAAGTLRLGDPVEDRPLSALGMVTAYPSRSDAGIVVDHPSATADSVYALRLNRNGTRQASIDATGRVFLSTADEPSTPSGGGILYVSTGGLLKYKSPGGTVTTIAPY